MSDRVKSKIPVVWFHAHSFAGSLFDAVAYPGEHMDFDYENGGDALALTDHGNANGLSYQVIHAKKMKEEGKQFKPIFGTEAYFLPSLATWREEYEKALEDKKRAKTLGSELSAATVEDENSSKKIQDVLRRRRHLILLATSQKGLQNIFMLISESYKSEDFYRYPRMDYDMFAKYREGVIAAASGVGGVDSGDYWERRCGRA